MVIRRFGDVDLDMAKFSRSYRPNTYDNLWVTFVYEFTRTHLDMAKFSRSYRPNKYDNLCGTFVDEFLSAREDGVSARHSIDMC